MKNQKKLDLSQRQTIFENWESIEQMFRKLNECLKCGRSSEH